MERRLAAILAADVVGYSRMMGIDEAGTLSTVKTIRSQLIEPKIDEHQGRIVKLMGDGILAEFPSVVNAVSCAIQIQRGVQEYVAGLPPERTIQFRIGVNLGDVIVENDDIHGDGVNVAARLQSVAIPDGIAVSQSVRDQVGNRLDITFEDRGEQQLKNIAKPIRVYDVLLEEPVREMPSTETERPSIAVLPFTNMSGDPEQEYFSDGITEDIITDLSKVSGLSVIARHSAFSYKGKPLKVQQVGRELGVGFVVEGSVRKAGARVRVTGQLVDCRDGSHLWADRFDRDLTDIFTIQDDITHAIVEQLKVKLLPQEQKSIEQAPTDNPEAYTFYLKGRQFLQRGSKAYYRLARQLFVKATELDPQYARAYAGIADCDSFLFLQTSEEIAVDSILDMSAKALALDNGLAEAHASRGFALSLGGQIPEAVTELDKALQLNPDSFEANHFYGRVCFNEGKFERAAELFKRATEVNPADYQSPLLSSLTYRSLGLDSAARDAARTALARAEREAVLHPEDPRPAQISGATLIDLGEFDRAREWIARSLTIAPNDMLTQYNAACSYTRLGDLDRAFDLLEQALRMRSTSHWRKWVEHDPDLNDLRNHPRFQKILELVGEKS